MDSKKTCEKPRRRRGRPPGIWKYDQPSILKTHRMTAKAHEWVKNNKAWIENEARK